MMDNVAEDNNSSPATLKICKRFLLAIITSELFLAVELTFFRLQMKKEINTTAKQFYAFNSFSTILKLFQCLKIFSPRKVYQIGSRVKKISGSLVFLRK